MDLRLRIDGRVFAVRAESRGDVLRVDVDGAVFDARVSRKDGDYVVALGDRTLRVRVGKDVDVGGVVHDVEVLALSKGPLAVTGPAAGFVEVHPPMPGRVVEVLVEPGRDVDHGTPLLLLEAMKMQNEVPSPTRGVVREVRVAKGTMVGADDVLVVIEGDGG
jgi:biotin carboxyl carrier protein